MKRKKKSRKALSAEADRLFSLFIRQRDNWTCRECGRTDGLQCAHIISRRYRGTRWDAANAVCLCSRCHVRYTWDVLGWQDWIESHIDQDIYSTLKRIARGIAKDIDLEVIVGYLKQATESGKVPA